MVKTKKSTAQAKVAKKVVDKALKQRGLKTVEPKYYSELGNLGVAQNTTIWAASSNIANPIVQSDQHNGRDGYQIQPVRYEAKGVLSVSNGYSGTARVLFIRWDDTAIPTLADIFESPSTPNSLPTALFNQEKRKHFKVYYDKRFVLSSLADSYGRQLFDIKVNCRSHKPVIYTTGAYSESAFTQGRYYLLYMSDNDATNGPLIEWTQRFFYTG